MTPWGSCPDRQRRAPIDARISPAIPKAGRDCPTGYYTRGDYCQAI